MKEDGSRTCSTSRRVMPRIGRIRVGLLAFLAVGLAASACGDPPPTGVPPVAVLSVTPEARTLRAIQDTVRLTATARDANGSDVPGKVFTWSSSDPAVASVTALGVVTAVAPGAATITASADGLTGRVDVKVDPWAAVEAGSRQTCALAESGALFCWGDGVSRPYRLAAAAAFTRVDLGREHRCAVARDGAAYCWGGNAWGQLGTGTFEPSETPVEVAGGLKFSSVVVMVPSGSTGAHTCGFTMTGAVYCWGAAESGQLGIGPTDELETCEFEYLGMAGPCSSVPVEVAGGHTFVAVSAGSMESCGLAPNGDLFCWGRQLANGNDVPELVESETELVAITGMFQHYCGIGGSGTGYCWGADVFGKLGTDPESFTGRPAPVLGGYTWASISAGVQHTCGVTTESVTYCWGHNNSAALGTGTVGGSIAEPARVETEVPFSAVSAGSGHSCAIAGTGAIYCWGYGGYGALGRGDFEDTAIPVRVMDPLEP